MALNYSKGKPMGDNQMPFYDSPPAIVALAASMRETAATSSILNLTDDTTQIEVAAVGGPAYIKWLSQATVDSSVAGTSIVSAATGANFDNAIPSGTVRHFVVPISQQYAQGYSSFVGANIANGLYKNVAIIGTASVATTQYR